MLAVAASLLAVAIVVYMGNPTSTDLPTAVQAVEPAPNDEVLSQTDIKVDLAVGYTAEVEVNGVPIPEEQLTRVEALNQVSFQPGPDQSVTRLLPDRNCVRVRYWLIAAGDQDAKFYNWCFTAS